MRDLSSVSLDTSLWMLKESMEYQEPVVWGQRCWHQILTLQLVILNTL